MLLTAGMGQTAGVQTLTPLPSGRGIFGNDGPVWFPPENVSRTDLRGEGSTRQSSKSKWNHTLTAGGHAQGDSAPRRHWVMSGHICGPHNWDAPGIEWVGAGDTAQLPTVP